MATMMPRGQGTAAATYSFSSQPKPVSAARKKYREPGEVDVTMYRDLKETCITWDKRVHRGNTYSLYTQNAIKEALQDSTQQEPPKVRRKRQPKEKMLFDMPLPEQERIPIDLTKHLVAHEDKIEVETVEAQTDEFLPEPPQEQYEPQKTGVDVYTQVEEGDPSVFNFDLEVEGILDVLVNKTLEQSIMEVDEEYEMEQMAQFKCEWYERQSILMKEWHKQVDEEWVQWEKKERVVKVKREEKEREARALLKIQAMAAAKTHLSRLVPNAVTDLQEVAFPDMKGMAVNRLFLPQLLGRVQMEVRATSIAKERVDEVVSSVAAKQATTQSSAFEAHKTCHRELERKRYEELQIRQGKIRILVDKGNNSTVSVGPIQISSQDDIGEVQSRVFEWLQANEPSLASAWPWGVDLCIDGLPAQATTDIFETKAGQISMVPKEAPPPQEEEPVEGEEGETGDVSGS